MPVSGDEIASLDFANLIGGPLNAMVEAQAKSAITTADFIKNVGFDGEGKVVNVNFRYNKNIEIPGTPASADGTTAAVPASTKVQEFNLTVPFLTMVPIPYIKIDTGEIEFNAKITSTTFAKTASEFKSEASLSVSSRWWVKADFKATTSFQRKSEAGDEMKREFSMRILVKVSNADIPAGTDRILTILQNTIEEAKTAKVAEDPKTPPAALPAGG